MAVTAPVVNNMTMQIALVLMHWVVGAPIVDIKCSFLKQKFEKDKKMYV